MKYSVIIPVLNEEATIAEAIERAWSAGAGEVIVCDGGSRDATVRRAAALPCRLIHSSPGRAVQQNAAAAAAVGDVLVFLHADCWLEPGGLEPIAAGLADGRTAGGAFRQRIDAAGLIYRLLERGNACRVRWLRLPYGDQGIFVRRDVFESLGRFPQIPLMEDVRFMRAFRRRWRPLLLPGPLHVSARRWQRSGPIRQTLRNWSLLAAEACGVPPDRLQRYYPPPSGSGGPEGRRDGGTE